MHVWVKAYSEKKIQLLWNEYLIIKCNGRFSIQIYYFRVERYTVKFTAINCEQWDEEQRGRGKNFTFRFVLFVLLKYFSDVLV